MRASVESVLQDNQASEMRSRESQVSLLPTRRFLTNGMSVEKIIQLKRYSRDLMELLNSFNEGEAESPNEKAKGSKA